MTLAMQVEPAQEGAPAVDYRWDADTDILSVSLAGVAPCLDAAAIELEGEDGSWLILDVGHGRLMGLEVAVWPEVRTRARLSPPGEVCDARLLVRDGALAGRGVEIETLVTAESDTAEEVIYFRVGASRTVRTVRVGRDLLVDLDRQQRIAGLWLLNVPPFPSSPLAP